MSDSTIEGLNFTHVVLEGTPYEIGYMQGETIKNYPEAVAFFTSGEGQFSDLEFARIQDAFDDFCPGLNEELEGFADSLQVSPEQVVYYGNTFLRGGGDSPAVRRDVGYRDTGNWDTGNCGHMVALPPITENGHVLVGRNYEFSDSMDDLRLCTTRVRGKAAHIGFSTFIFGRGDGMNEHGLSVTMSSAGLPVGMGEGMQPPHQDGFHFWALIRALLDQCRSVEGALSLVLNMPLCCNLNLIIADRYGKAALVEIVGENKAIKSLDSGSEEQCLWSANHLSLPEMVEHLPYAMRNSLVRSGIIESGLKQFDGVEEKKEGGSPQSHSPAIGRETLRKILSDPYPEGLCCPYYNEFFGTLRSMVFDLTAREAEICFGSPALNEWHTFDFKNNVVPGIYKAKIVKEKAGPEFWEMLPLKL